MNVMSLRHEDELQEIRDMMKEMKASMLRRFSLLKHCQREDNVAAMQAFETRSLLVVSTMRPLMMCLRWCCCSSMD